MVGISNGSFGTLGAVYGLRIGLDVPEIAIMMSLALLAGAVVQIPVGMLSDRLDRRLVLVGLAVTAMSFGSSLSFFGGTDPTLTVLLIAGFGGVVYSMYPVIVAHASDHAEPGDFLRISGGLLLIFGAGTMLGPLLASGLMTFTYPGALFQVTAAAHLSMMLFALWRMRQRASLPQEDKSDFVMAVSTAQITTPETVSLDPRTEVDETGGEI